MSRQDFNAIDDEIINGPSVRPDLTARDKAFFKEAGSVINESLRDIVRGWGKGILSGSFSLEDAPEWIQGNVQNYVNYFTPKGQFGDRYDGKEFTKANYNTIQSGGGDPNNDGVVTDEEWTNWMLGKGPTPGYEEAYERKLREVADQGDLSQTTIQSIDDLLSGDSDLNGDGDLFPLPEEAPIEETPLPEELPPPASLTPKDYLSEVQNSFAAMSEEDQAAIFKGTSTGTPIEQALYDQLLNNVFAKGGIGFEIDPNDGTSLLLKIPVGIPSIGGPMRIKILNEDGSLVPLPDVLGEAKNKVAQAGKDILAIPGQILDEARGALGNLKDLGGVVAGTSKKTLTEVLGEIFSGVLVEGSDTLPKTGWMGQGILGDIYDIFLKEVDDWKSGGDPSKFGGDPFPVAPVGDGLPVGDAPPPGPSSDTPLPESPFGEKPPEVDPDLNLDPELEPELEPELGPELEPELEPDLDPSLDPDLDPDPGKNPDDDPKDDDPKDDDPKDDDPKDDEKPDEKPGENPVIIDTTPPPETLVGDGGETVDDPPEESGGGGGGGGAGGMFEPYSGAINYGLPQFQAVPYNLKKDYNASLDRIMQESLFGNFN